MTSFGKVGSGDCEFAGKEYEQGAFVEQIIPEHQESFNEASPFVWNNWEKSCNGESSFEPGACRVPTCGGAPGPSRRHRCWGWC